jgi:hypothetical protein
MEAGSDFQKRSDSPPHFNATLCRVSDPGQNLQKGALASAVSPNYADYFTLFRAKGNILERPDDVVVRPPDAEGVLHEFNELFPQ